MTQAVDQLWIAGELGLSQGTVSQALAGNGRVAAATRKRVLDTARRHGYRPNPLASGLRRGHTRSIGMIWAFADPWAGDAVVALKLLDRLQAQRYAVYQAQRSDDTTTLCRQIDDLIGRQVDALVLLAIPRQLRDPEVLGRLKEARGVVAVTREPMDDFPGDLIVHNRLPAIEQVVAHLAATGRRRPGIMLCPGQESNPVKIEHFRRCCRAHGIADHPHSLIELGYPDAPEAHGERHRRAIVEAFPSGRPNVDAVFCFNDVGAFYVMRELADRGVSVPDEVALVGFNNSQAGRVWSPPLATGDRAHDQLTDALDEVILERLASPDREPMRRTIPMRFVHRASAGPLPLIL